MSVGKRIRIGRSLQGKSLKEVSENLGVTIAALSRYELDQREPSLDILRKLADELKLPISFFIGEPPFDNLELLDLFKSVIIYNLQLHNFMASNIAVSSVDNYTYYQVVANHISSIKQLSEKELSIIYKSEDGTQGKEEKQAFTQYYISLGNNEMRVKLTRAFNELNDLGQQKAIERLEELAKIPDYQKGNE
ncbi:MAG: helix-turn-helix domain-containing protein [Ruthenibacterium lactatiformans]|uniref:helix-turn-helix domain-containing protein n=1 Tax=Ruthenibacterium lactatiformans TaxID=1550024 RepID=UPI00266C3BDD|nr:helix-turn-helix transcriptional regulator [Ruthenibacterium lactatiformans]